MTIIRGIDLDLNLALRSILAGIGGVVGSFVLAGLTPGFIAAPISGVLSRQLPAVVIRYAITLLGSLGQQLNLLTAIGLAILFLSLLAYVGIFVERRVEFPLLGAILAGTGGAVFGILLTGDPTTALGAGGGTAAVLAVSTLAEHIQRVDARLDAKRRSVLGGVASLAGLGVLGVVYGRQRTAPAEPEEPQALSDQPETVHTVTPTATSDRANSAQPTPTPDVSSTPLPSTPTPTPTPNRSELEQLLFEADQRSLDVDGLEPLVSDAFYEVDINAVNPEVNTDNWELKVTGAVENEVTFTWDDITAMAAEHRFVTLRCVGEPLNGKKMDTALWTGIPVNALLDQASPASDCDCVMLRAADDYYEEFPLEALRGGLLAYGMNGEVLPRGHGYPLRALVPGHWGEVNVKWLTEIELLESETKGYWEKRGWHGTGPVHTVAKLHEVNHLDDAIQVAGHTYAGTRGIERVEVSVDGGDWVEATLSEPLPGDDVWRQWVHEYDPPSGEHEVMVRAVDGTGTVQPKEMNRPFPNGATGWVTRIVNP